MPDGQHILIVEDDEKWQLVLLETLEDEDYDVTLVANYRDGRQTLEDRSFDLVILDLNLDESAPMLDGERLLRRLSRHHAGTPCIIVSGQGDVHIVRNAFKQYHVVDFIAKDQFDIAAFIQIVQDATKVRTGQDKPGSTSTFAPLQQTPNADVGVWGKRAPEQKFLNKLLQILIVRFSESELRTLCFHLGVDHDTLPDGGKQDKARELILRLKKRERIFELVQAGKQLRPDIPWDDVS